jgi:flagellar hook-associated protein 1 FlgK
MSGKTASLQEAYAQLVSEIGNKTRQVQVTGETQRTLLEQAQSSRDSLSGVNLDEEAANLIRYQQAYQASAKAMQIGASLFDTILQIAAG